MAAMRLTFRARTPSSIRFAQLLRILDADAFPRRRRDPVVLDKHLVFVTGGTGFMGRRLVASLLRRGHNVKALVRDRSQHKLPNGAQPVLGDPLLAESNVSA
jgi:FlaA1/EpsC-like NDP-sugar epimerase